MTKRVLVVEDDALLGLDLAQQLTNAGFKVIGPAISVAKAFSHMEQSGCDIAVLDVNLGRSGASLKKSNRCFLSLSTSHH